MEEYTLFKELVVLCQNLESTPKKREKTQLIGDFLRQLKAGEISSATLLILGSIFPNEDKRILHVSGANIHRLWVEPKDNRWRLNR